MTQQKKMEFTLNTHNQHQQIAIFHRDMTHQRGGEKYIYELFKRISSAYCVTLYCESISSEWKMKIKAEGILVKSLWRPKRIYWLFVPVMMVVNYIHLRKSIKNSTVIFSTNFPLSFLALLLSKKTIYHCFEPLAIFYDKTSIQALPTLSRFIVQLIKFLYAPLDIFVVRKCSVLTTVNQSVQKFIIKIYNRFPDTQLPNGVDRQLYSLKRLPLYKRNNHFPVLTHSTDFTLLKGTEKLLFALPRVVARYPKTHLYISESTMNERVKKSYQECCRLLGITKHVTFVGQIPDGHMARFYCSGDMYCYCGAPECGGGSTASLSVLEAQACGSPVIRSYGNTDEIIRGKSGFYVQPNNPVDVANKILLISEYSFRRRQLMGLIGRKHTKNFSWENTESALKHVLHTLYSTHE